MAEFYGRNGGFGLGCIFLIYFCSSSLVKAQITSQNHISQETLGRLEKNQQQGSPTAVANPVAACSMTSPADTLSSSFSLRPHHSSLSLFLFARIRSVFMSKILRVAIATALLQSSSSRSWKGDAEHKTENYKSRYAPCDVTGRDFLSTRIPTAKTASASYRYRGGIFSGNPS